MNPSFMAMNKAITSMMFGHRHVPKAKGAQETSINGRAFAPGKGVQQEMSGPEKEAKVDAHLAQLRKDVEVRTGVIGGHKYERVGYPCSDMVTEANEHQAQRELAAQLHASDLLDKTNTAFKVAQTAHGVPHWMPGAFRDIDLANARALDDAQQAEKEDYNTAADAKVMTALYGSDNDAKIDERSTHEQALDALHRTHAAYIDRQIALNRRNTSENAIPIGADIPYPVSDLITLRNEEQERRERAINAAIHTGDRRFEAK